MIIELIKQTFSLIKTDAEYLENYKKELIEQELSKQKEEKQKDKSCKKSS